MKHFQLSRNDRVVRNAPSSGSAPSGLRMRRLGVATLLALSVLAPACTPEEIEMSLDRISSSFEQGGVERGLAEAVFVVDYAIPVVGMRLGSALGP